MRHSAFVTPQKNTQNTMMPRSGIETVAKRDVHGNDSWMNLHEMIFQLINPEVYDGADQMTQDTDDKIETYIKRLLKRHEDVYSLPYLQFIHDYCDHVFNTVEIYAYDHREKYALLQARHQALLNLIQIRDDHTYAFETNSPISSQYQRRVDQLQESIANRVTTFYYRLSTSSMLALQSLGEKVPQDRIRKHPHLTKGKEAAASSAQTASSEEPPKRSRWSAFKLGCSKRWNGFKTRWNSIPLWKKCLAAFGLVCMAAILVAMKLFLPPVGWSMTAAGVHLAVSKSTTIDIAAVLEGLFVSGYGVKKIVAMSAVSGTAVAVATTAAMKKKRSKGSFKSSAELPEETKNNLKQAIEETFWALATKSALHDLELNQTPPRSPVGFRRRTLPTPKKLLFLEEPSRLTMSQGKTNLNQTRTQAEAGIRDTAHKGSSRYANTHAHRLMRVPDVLKVTESGHIVASDADHTVTQSDSVPLTMAGWGSTS